MESQNTERAVADRVCECVLSRPPLEKEIKDLAGMEQGCRKVKRSLELPGFARPELNHQDR